MGRVFIIFVVFLGTLVKGKILSIFCLGMLFGFSVAQAMNQPNNYELCKAAGCGDKEAVEACLERGDDVDTVDSEIGMTPLACAVSDLNVDMVQYLLFRADANPNIEDNSGMTPLWTLLQYDDSSQDWEDIVSILCSFGAEEWDATRGMHFQQAHKQIRAKRARDRDEILKGPKRSKITASGILPALSNPNVCKCLFP